MTGNLSALTPLIVLGATPLALMLLIAFCRSHLLTALAALIGLALTLAVLPRADLSAAYSVTPLLVIDGYALFYTGLLAAGTVVVVVLSYAYMDRQPGNREEFYLLLTLATFGSAVLAASNHFASFFLGLEILSVSLYGLVAYLRGSERGLEAGIKYLILAAASAAFLLFGMALVYGDLGTLDFSVMAGAMGRKASDPSLLLVGGFAMIFIGIGFKLALVPFHMWAPDVYQGAPTPITAYLTTVSKGAMLALVLRYGQEGGMFTHESVAGTVAVIAVASMFIGNLLALLQDNLKRLFAYSSISHLGYMLVAVLAGSEIGIEAVTYYLVAYFITSLGIFGIITVLSDERKDADDIGDYRGLFWRRPFVSGVLTLMMFSLAGIPFTAGFMGKAYLLLAGVDSQLWTLVLLLVISSVIGVYYYLRVIVIMYVSSEEGEEAQTLPATRRLSLPEGLVIAGLTFLLIWFGIKPAALVGTIQAAVESMT